MFFGNPRRVNEKHHGVVFGGGGGVLASEISMQEAFHYVCNTSFLIHNV